MIRLSLFIWLVAVAAAAIGLYHIKDRVQDLEAKLAETERQIIADREAVHVLRAEWAYLNKPGRLAELSERYLDLAPLDQSHLASFDAMPDAPDLEAETQQAVAQGETDDYDFDSMIQLIGSTNSEPPAPTGAEPTAPASDSHTRPRVLVNPVTGNPLPLPGGSLVLTGAGQ